MILLQLSFALHTCKRCKCEHWLHSYFSIINTTVNSHCMRQLLNKNYLYYQQCMFKRIIPGSTGCPQNRMFWHSFQVSKASPPRVTIEIVLYPHGSPSDPNTGNPELMIILRYNSLRNACFIFSHCKMSPSYLTVFRLLCKQLSFTTSYNVPESHDCDL